MKALSLVNKEDEKSGVPIHCRLQSKLEDKPTRGQYH